MQLIEDQRWKRWWNGSERPVLVLSPTEFRHPAYRAALEDWFPGVKLMERNHLKVVTSGGI